MDKQQVWVFKIRKGDVDEFVIEGIYASRSTAIRIAERHIRNNYGLNVIHTRQEYKDLWSKNLIRISWFSECYRIDVERMPIL
jgi:hypothetical protein